MASVPVMNHLRNGSSQCKSFRNGQVREEAEKHTRRQEDDRERRLPLIREEEIPIDERAVEDNGTA